MTIPPPPTDAAPLPLRAHRRPADGPSQKGGAARRARVLKTVASWTLSLLIVVATWGLTQVKMDDDARYDPFITRAAVGERAETRNLIVTVTDVHAARAVTDGERWRAEGTWLVVDLDAAAAHSQFGAVLRVAHLRLGERTYSATERVSSLRETPLVTGVAQHGSIAFELPEGDLRGPATLVFAGDYDYSADGVIEVPVDLDQVAVEHEVALEKIGWAE